MVTKKHTRKQGIFCFPDTVNIRVVIIVMPLASAMTLRPILCIHGGHRAHFPSLDEDLQTLEVCICEDDLRKGQARCGVAGMRCSLELPQRSSEATAGDLCVRAKNPFLKTRRLPTAPNWGTPGNGSRRRGQGKTVIE